MEKRSEIKSHGIRVLLSNHRAIRKLKKEFDSIRRSILNDYDVIIGSDICFCDTLVDPLRRLIQRAKNAGVSQIIISDPGRGPFDDLSGLYAKKRDTELINWEIGKIVNGETSVG